MLSSAARAEVQSNPKVLVLHSYHQGYLWTDMIQEAFSRTLSEQYPKAEVYVEYMNTKRQTAEVMFPHLANIYEQLYSKVKFDVIVASDNNALDFLILQGERLFPKVPVVFCGINNFLNYKLAPGSQFTGVREDLDIASTIDVALKLHPATRKIALITDSTETGQINLGLARNIAHRFPDIAFIELNKLSTAELNARLKSLEKDTVVLALAFFRDQMGRTFSARESMEFIVSASPRPVYTVWDFYMAQGTVGGKLLSGRLQGENAASFATKILRGENTATLPVMESPTAYIFNHSGLQKFGVDESLLPAEAVVTGRPDTFYSRYRIYLWIGAVVFIAQVLLIILLLRNIASRRRGEAAHQEAARALTETNNMFSAFLMHSPIYVFIKEMRLTESRLLMASENFHDMVGMAVSDMIGKTMKEVFPADFANRIDSADRAVVASGQPLRTDETLNDRSYTSIRFPLVQGDKNLVAGYYIDVTERKHNEIELSRYRDQLESLVSLRTQELEAKNQVLQQTLTQLQTTQDQLIEASKLASLGELVAGIAHELNTPIGNARSIATTLCYKSTALQKELATGNIRRSQFDDYVDQVNQGNQLLDRNLMRAVDLIVSFKQVAVDRASSQRRLFDLRRVTEEVISTLYPTLKKTPFTLTMDIPQGISIDGYPGPLGQVIVNLIENSLIHGLVGQSNGNIHIQGSALDGAVEIIVSDDGRGIPDAFLERVFDPFFTTRLGQGGSGLGLNIVYNIVTGLLGGRITVKSPVGEGAAFTIQIPLTAPARPDSETIIHR